MRLAQQVLDMMRAEKIGPAPALTFSSHDHHGWRRMRRGNCFTYADFDGKRPSRTILPASRLLDAMKRAAINTVITIYGRPIAAPPSSIPWPIFPRLSPPWGIRLERERRRHLRL